MKWNNSILIIIIAVLILFNTTLISEKSCDVKETLNISVTAVKNPTLGFNTETDGLKFGHINPGATSTRTISLKHSQNASFKIFIEGSIKSWIKVNPQKAELLAEEPQTITFDLTLPHGTSLGPYFGEATICIKE